MFENIDTSLIDWSRAQFALTAMYHWLFVPLTLGLAVIMGLMETFYVTTGKEFWKNTAKFWMKLFGINFAVGVATGLILEFEFGTNWSNYSWFVGVLPGQRRHCREQWREFRCCDKLRSTSFFFYAYAIKKHEAFGYGIKAFFYDTSGLSGKNG